ncbi:MAG: pyridoxal phosphate-dependent aminotransferase [Chloroflexota bacterium]
MTVTPRQCLAGLSPTVHGGPDYAEYRELGISPDDVLDFSVNANPSDPPPELRRILAGVSVSRYPDTESWAVRQAAGRRFGQRPEQVLAGNGSAELIWLACLAYLQPGDSVLVGHPTFGEYEAAARVHGARVARVALPLTGGDPPARWSAELETHRPRVAFICNPNNPTGRLLAPEGLREMFRHHPDTLFAVDEAYVDFVAGAPSLLEGDIPANLVVLRSMTKFSALAGLRLGLAFGSPDAVAGLRAVKPPWNVNAMAQAAGVYALEHSELGPDLAALGAANRELRGGLESLGLEPLPSDCNFFLLPIGALAARLRGSGTAAARVRRALLGRGILVRDCTSFGLPEHVRLSLRPPEDGRALLAAVAELAGERR